MKKRVELGAAQTKGEDSPQTALIPTCLFLVGLALRTYGITAHSLSGDEFGSVSGAMDLGVNWNSIAYFAFMHFWINVSTSELFLRLPALFCGALTIPVVYKIGQSLGGKRLALAAGLLCALSPFNIAHSQEVRFYTLFPLATSLSFFAIVRFHGGHRSLLDKGVVLGSMVLVVASHFLGVIVAGVYAVSLLSTRLKPKMLVAILIILFTLITVALYSAEVQKLAWDFIRVYGDAKNTTTVVVTSLSFLNVAKIFFGLFAFCLGYEVYPLWLWLVVPALILYSLLGLNGIVWAKSQTASRILMLLTTLGFLFVFLVLDPFGGRVATGVAPRHASFFWPILMLLLAGGIARSPRLFWPALLLVGNVNVAALACRWNGSWSAYPGTDWHEAITFINPHLTPSAVVINDGRSAEGMSFYGKPEWHRVSTWDLEQNVVSPIITESCRVVFVANDFQDARRPGLSALLQRLQAGRTVTGVRVRYPLFQYVLDPAKSDTAMEAAPPAYTALELPLELYDLRFQDLQLPALVSLGDVSYQIKGSTDLPTLSDCDSISIPCDIGRPVTAIIFLSNLSGYGNTQIGAPVGNLTVRQNDSTSWSVPIRNGVETDDWLFKRGADQSSGSVSGSSYQIAHTWHKRVQIVGKSAYEGAWLDGDAKIYSTSLVLPESVVPQSLTVKLLKREGGGKMHLWGILLTRKTGEV